LMPLTIYHFLDKKKKVNTRKQKTARIVVKVDYDPKQDPALIAFRRKLKSIWRFWW